MSGNCLIWDTPISSRWHDEKNVRIQTVDSPRAGGKYVYHDELRLPGGPLDQLDKFGKARLTTWLVNKRKEGEERPVITSENIRSARRGRKMLMKQRLGRILQFLENNGGPIIISPGPSHAALDDKVAAYYQLLAHSESIEWSDLKELLFNLEEKGLILRLPAPILVGRRYSLTVDGTMYLDELRDKTPDSDKVFVAMWFDQTLDHAYDKAIDPAIREAGYVPKRADKEQFVHQIYDWIIEEIGQARFVVADFSQGEDGPRGGVYYEVGYAHGLGRDVVFTCREKDAEKIHFDTNHYNHILWKTEDDLKKRLKERIIEVMGVGPRKGESSEP